MRPQGTGPRGMLPPGPRPKGVEPQDSPQKPAPGAWRLQGPGKGLPKNLPGDPPEGKLSLLNLDCYELISYTHSGKDQDKTILYILIGYGSSNNY